MGQFAAAASGAFDHDDTVALWVGGAKSSLAALSQWISPLGIDVPPATGDACADRAALGVAAERAGREERRRFWFSHLAGLAVTLGGAVVVAELTSWETGLESFAASYPVGLLATYTMPRASWARIREPAWTARLAAGGGRYALVVGGRF